MHFFLCFFLSTGDGEWCWEEVGVSGELRIETNVLGAELEQLGSEICWRAASMKIVLSLISWSFLVQEALTDLTLISPMRLSQAL